jgi:hypothetical protein
MIYELYVSIIISLCLFEMFRFAVFQICFNSFQTPQPEEALALQKQIAKQTISERRF